MVETLNEVSAGALVILERRQPMVVLLTQNNGFYKRPKSYPEVVDVGPKGRAKPGEDVEETAKRWIKEELGISLDIDKRFKEEYEYEFDEDSEGDITHIKKKVVYFIARITESELKNIKLSEEHTKVEIVPMAEAIAMIKYPNQRRVLAKCDEFMLLNGLK